MNSENERLLKNIEDEEKVLAKAYAELDTDDSKIN